MTVSPMEFPVVVCPTFRPWRKTDKAKFPSQGAGVPSHDWEPLIKFGKELVLLRTKVLSL